MSDDGPVERTRTLNASEADTNRDDRTSGPLAAGSTTEPVDGTADRPGTALTPRFLIALRENRRWRFVALLAATVLGVVLAWIHWLGLFVAGSLVGLASTSVPRALATGLILGVSVLLVNVLVIPIMSVGEFVELTPASYVTVAVSLVAPLWGSLVHGVL